MRAVRIELLDEEGSGADRRAGGDRAVVSRSSTVRGADRVAHDVRVENLSARGFAFVADNPFPVGSAIEVGLSGAGSARARIVRRDDRVFGCVFDRPLSIDRMALAFSAPDVAMLPVGHGLPAPVPHWEKWPGSIRLAVWLAGAVGGWAALAGLVGLATG